MSIINHLNKLPEYAIASTLTTHLVSGLNLGKEVTLGATLVSDAMKIAARPVLALRGLMVMAGGVKSLLTRQNQARPPIRARRTGNGVELYREQVSLGQKIKKVAGKVIPAAGQIVFGYLIASNIV